MDESTDIAISLQQRPPYVLSLKAEDIFSTVDSAGKSVWESQLMVLPPWPENILGWWREFLRGHRIRYGTTAFCTERHWQVAPYPVQRPGLWAPTVQVLYHSEVRWISKENLKRKSLPSSQRITRLMLSCLTTKPCWCVRAPQHITRVYAREWTHCTVGKSCIQRQTRHVSQPV